MRVSGHAWTEDDLCWFAALFGGGIGNCNLPDFLLLLRLNVDSGIIIKGLNIRIPTVVFITVGFVTVNDNVVSNPNPETRV